MWRDPVHLVTVHLHTPNMPLFSLVSFLKAENIIIVCVRSGTTITVSIVIFDEKDYFCMFYLLTLNTART